MSLRPELEALFRAGLEAVEGGRAVEHALRERGLFPEKARITVLAAGKAAGCMVEGALRALGADVVGGFGVSRDEPEGRRGPVDLVCAGHPLPDARSQAAGERALRIASSESDPLARILVLLSGGASALWAAPVPGVTLEDKRRLTDALLHAGATIEQLNAVRKHLSRIKGGGLARAARVPLVTLALSDVAGDRPDVIGSGPTVTDPSTYADAVRVVERFGVGHAAPSCWGHLRAGAREEHTEGLASREDSDREFHVVGSLSGALAAVGEAARSRGLRVRSLGAALRGEARDLAGILAGEARRARELGVDLLIAGGEPTVHVRGPGRGGRAQELALAFALAAEADPGVGALFAGTDGSDGPTEAAGAYVGETSLAAARAAGVDPYDALMRNDSYRFHSASGGLFTTGPTGTNVTDLALIRIRRSAART